MRSISYARKILVCIAYLTLSMACLCEKFEKTTTYKLHFFNQSDETIYYYKYLYSSSDKTPSELTAAMVLDGWLKFTIQPNEEFLGDFVPDPAEYDYDNYQIMVFKQSTLDKYSKVELMENNIYDKLYVFSFEELEAMDFKIVYTGE